MSMTFRINDIIKRLVHYQLECGDIELRLSDDYYETSWLLEMLADAMQEIDIANSADENMSDFNSADNVILFPKTNKS